MPVSLSLLSLPLPINTQGRIHMSLHQSTFFSSSSSFSSSSLYLSKMAPVHASAETPSDAPNRSSVKALVDSPGLASIPTHYSYSTNASAASDPEDTIPTIDYSMLVSGDPDQRAKVIQEIDRACQEWGFFMLVNHGVPKSLMKAVLDGCAEFFELPVEEKQEYAVKDIWKPIRFGTGVDVKVEKFFFWRDFLKTFVHPEFHCPPNPKGFSDDVREYSESVRKVTRELLRGISEGLGLEQSYIEKATNFDSGCQIFASNLYPPCPEPERAIGIPAHTDHSLLTFLIENEIGGLQIQHKGKWFHVNPIPNSFLVNTADHLEILSNGRYKSIMHRAVVNNKNTRISIAVPNGPSLDTVVGPAPELVERAGGRPKYKPMKFKDYLDYQLINGSQCLDSVRLPVA